MHGWLQMHRRASFNVDSGLDVANILSVKSTFGEKKYGYLDTAVRIAADINNTCNNLIFEKHYYEFDTVFKI